MALRTVAVMLILAGLQTSALAQRGRRGYGGGHQGYYHGRYPGHGPIHLPGYPPYVPFYGGQFAPVQYFTPPVFINGFQPNGVFNAVPYGRRQPFFGGIQVNGVPFSQAGPAYQPFPTSKPLPEPEKPQEIEPEPIQIQVQQAGAGDRLAAIRFQAQGDSLFRTRNHSRAFGAYKASLTADSSRPEPYFRLAALFAAINRYEPAIRHLKQGLDLAPSFPKTGDRLDRMYGVANAELKHNHLNSLVSWANHDPRSADRQLLAGALLHFDDQQDRALPYLERASQLSQRPSRAIALLSARNNAAKVLQPNPPGLVLPPEPETAPLPQPGLVFPKEPATPKQQNASEVPFPNLPIPDLPIPPAPHQ